MAYQKVYMNQIHSSSLLCQLSQMWKRDILCDAVIRTGSVTTKAHRIVLVAACPMLQSMDGAAVGNRLEVKLSPDIYQESVTAFLQYLYDGFMMLTEDNVRDVEKIARMLQVDSVAKCCADFYKVLQSEVGQTLGHEAKFSFHADEAEFRHVRASELLRSMQNGSEKRSLDSEEGLVRKKAKGQRHYQTMSRQTTEESFEYIQVDNDATVGTCKPVTQQSVSVSSRTDNNSQDVQVLNIADTDDYSATNNNLSSRHLHSPYLQPSVNNKPSNFDLIGSRTSPSLQKQKSSPQAFIPSLRTPGGAKPRLLTLMSASANNYPLLSSSHQDLSSKSVHPPLKPLIKSKSSQGDTEKDGEQIVIHPVDVQEHRSSPQLIQGTPSPNVPPALESDAQGRSFLDTGGGAVKATDSQQDYAEISCSSSGPDMSIVKVEKTDYEYDDSMTGTQGDDYGAGEEGDEDGSDTEMYNYGDMSHMSASGDDPASSWYTQTFKDFLQQNDEPADFEILSSAELDEALTRFYQTAVISPQKLKHFPAKLSRHLNSAPFYRNLNIETDPVFDASNKIISHTCGNAHSEDFRRKKPMTQEDLNKLYESGVLSNDNPTSLQNKVWVELMIYVGGLARQDLRNLEKDHFVFEKDEEGRLYFRLDAQWMTDAKKQIHVFEQPDNLNCPVRSLWLYLSKLNHKSAVFFQQPFKESIDTEEAVWYSFRPIGKNAHSTWLANICKEAGVTTEYRNQALYCRAAPFKSEKAASVVPKK